MQVPNSNQLEETLSLREEQVQTLLERKHYIKQNVKQVKQIEGQVKNEKQEKVQKAAAETQAKAKIPKGAIPKYLVARKA